VGAVHLLDSAQGGTELKESKSPTYFGKDLEVIVQIPQPSKPYRILAREYIGTTYLVIDDRPQITINTDALDAFCRQWVETHK
jgi:hypothetical protein